MHTRKSDTWEIIYYDATFDEWIRPAVAAAVLVRDDYTFATRLEAEGLAKHYRFPTYVRTTRELDSIGLPEGPPPANKKGK